MQPRIVGIDPSLTGTAWADTRIADTGRITTKLDGEARLLFIREAVLDVVFRSDLVVIEGYSYASRHGSHQLGELGGVLRLALIEARRRFVVMAPTARAKFATGKGNASKDLVVSTVSALTGTAFANNDECDAYVLACAGLSAYGFPTPFDDNQAALESVEWPTLGLGPDAHRPVVKFKPSKKGK